MSLFAIPIQRVRTGRPVFIWALVALCGALLPGQRPTKLSPLSIPQFTFVPYQRANPTPASPPPRATDPESPSAHQHESAYRLANVTVEGNFLSTMRRAGVSAAGASMLADAFAKEVDFRHDLKPGDAVKLVFDRAGGDATLPLAARIELDRRNHQVFLFRDHRGRASYQDKHAPTRAPTMARFPLEVFRVSSAFSPRRFNPVTLQWQAHEGVDLAAPTGTPVRATGDGRVAFVGQQNGYGNVIKLANGGPYSTTFAHLSRFADGLRAGAAVHRGDLIGYVGQTGHATGPHLHYEVRVNGVPNNPLTIRLPAGEPIQTADAGSFARSPGELEALL
ncbi:MAG TPA: peptidoglycan DD-metalloendopeptidase family protein [Paraburkholderia sp.]|jgi:murein DD-endopeptidase MepM/ murein hydrolase activator NlpD